MLLQVGAPDLPAGGPPGAHPQRRHQRPRRAPQPADAGLVSRQVAAPHNTKAVANTFIQHVSTEHSLQMHTQIISGPQAQVHRDGLLSWTEVVFF